MTMQDRTPEEIRERCEEIQRERRERERLLGERRRMPGPYTIPEVRVRGVQAEERGRMDY
jgi:hypothetical protein